MPNGVLTVISGFSGAGKGTVMKELLSNHKYALSISATTRKPREGEQEGVNYFFKTREDFEQMIADKQLIEYAEYVGNYYGTPKEYVESRLQQGEDVLLEIETKGALQVKELYPEAVMIFIAPPSIQELRRRLVNRGTEQQDVIEARLKAACSEGPLMQHYDFIVVNDTVEQCVKDIHNIIQGMHYSRTLQQSFIQSINMELNEQ